MRIVVEVSPEELKEMDLTIDSLKESVIYDLEYSGDDHYSGYTVDIVCVDPTSSKMTLSRVIDYIRDYEEL